jgi:hypothetical protein
MPFVEKTAQELTALGTSYLEPGGAWTPYAESAEIQAIGAAAAIGQPEVTLGTPYMGMMAPAAVLEAYQAFKSGDPAPPAGVIAGAGEGAPDSMATIIPAIAMPPVEQGSWQETIFGPAGEYFLTSPKGVQELSSTALMVSGVPLLAKASGVAGKAAGLPAVITGVAAGLGGEGWGGALTAGLGLLGIGAGTAATILGLAGKIPVLASLLGGGGGGKGLMTTGGGQMTTGQSVSQYVSGGTNVQGVPFGGPGVPEPPAGMVSKMWKTKSFSNTKGE